ncbi:MAG: hypothetical protein ACOX47_10465 [Bacillota bacterium]|jgi:hypothetical protein
MFEEEKNRVEEKESKNFSGRNTQNDTFFGTDTDDNILDRSKRGLEKLSWFKRLFK